MFPLNKPYTKLLSTRRKLSIYITFILFIVFPGNFFGLINFDLVRIAGVVDKNVILLIISFTFLLINFKKIITPSKTYIEKYFIFLAIYVILYLITTITIFSEPPIEALKVFRNDYFLPVAALSIILFLKYRSVNEVNLFFWLIYYYALINILVYIIVGILFPSFISNILQFSYFAVSKSKYLNHLYPHFNSFVLFVSFYRLVNLRFRFFDLIVVGLIFFVDLHMGVRYTLALDILIIVFLTFLNVRNTILRLPIFMFIFFLFYISFNFSSVALFENSIIKVERIMTGLSYDYYDTYGFRLELINDAISWQNTQGNNILFGRGYIRTESFGDYDIALGGDSPVAAILITEGLLGVIFRLLFFAFLIKDVIKLHYNSKFILLFSIFFSFFTIINIVQTTFITNYIGIPLIMILFVLSSIKEKQKIIIMT